MKNGEYGWIFLSYLVPFAVLMLSTDWFQRPTRAFNLLLATAVLVALQFFLWHHRLKKPVGDLIRSIRRAINGDYQARFSCENISAFRRLSVAFNQLMSCVESQVNELSENRILQNQLYENEKIYRSALELTCERVFEADLSHNRVLYGCEKYKETFPFLSTKIYDEMISLIAQHCIFEGDSRKFVQTFSRDGLLNSYRCLSMPEIMMDYRLRGDNGTFVWYSATVIFLNSRSEEGLKIIGYIKNIDERKRQEIKILNESQEDGLTGLFNKKVTESMIGGFLNAEGHSGRHALIMVDVDNFKAINDSFGHAQGDVALTRVSQQLKHLFRNSDIVGRVGGDEFLILMKNVSDMDSLFEKLRLMEIYFHEIRLSDPSYRVHGSVGVSLFPDDGNDYSTLFEKADTALYYSKAHGKDQFCLFSDRCRESADARSELTAMDHTKRA